MGADGSSTSNVWYSAFLMGPVYPVYIRDREQEGAFVLDENGNKRKDVKNPDKSLRNVDIDKVVLVKGLKYDADDKEWSGAKIYDPTKGMRVNATATFVSKDKLKLRATILGIGQTIYWQKIK